MKHSSIPLAAGLALIALVVACDEGRLVTDVEREAAQAELGTVTGPATLLVGETATFRTTVTLGGATVTRDVVRWHADPPGRVGLTPGDERFTVQVRGLVPDSVQITARIEDSDLLPASRSRDFQVELLAVEAVAPASGDTILTALQDTMTIRARGTGAGGVAADSARLIWRHGGTAIQPLTASPADTVRFVSKAVGTDTIIFSQKFCTGKCADTVLIRVQQAPASIDPGDTIRFSTLGRERTAQAVVRDRNGNIITGAAVTWSLSDPEDSVVVAVASDGVLTAVRNGVVPIEARAGTVTRLFDVAVNQFVRRVEVLPDTVAFTALGAVDTARMTAFDSLDNPVTRPFTTDWISRDTLAVRISPVEGAGHRVVLTAVSTGSSAVQGTVESRRDSTVAMVSQTVSAVIITPDSGTINAIGFTMDLTAEARDALGNLVPGAPLTWASLDETVATVAAGVVTSTAVGTVGITATAAGGVVDTAAIVVRQVVATVKVTEPNPDTLIDGGTKQLAATAADSAGAAIPADPEAFVWGSNNPGVASVSTAGIVTGHELVVALDSARVGAILGAATDSVWVFVRQQIPSTIEITPSLDTVALGGTTSLAATVRDAQGEAMVSPGITWVSLDPTRATVDAAGVVTGVAATDTVLIVASVTSDPTIADTAHIIVVGSYVLEFDGGDYASAGNVLNFDPVPVAGWTIEVWVKPGSGSTNRYLLAKGGAVGQNSSAYGLYLNSDGRPTGFVRSRNGSNNFSDVVAIDPLTTGSWHHVAFTFDGATKTGTLYVNGAVKAEGNMPEGPPRSTDAALIFGASDTEATNGFSGRLDEIRFWSAARDADQIVAAYRTRLTGDEPGLLAYWPLNDGAGNALDIKEGHVITLPDSPTTPTWHVEIPVLPLP